MIKEALLHCTGIGPVRLQRLRELGVREWVDVIERPEVISNAYRQGLVDECRRCLEALELRDIAYFVDRLAPQDKWRVLAEFHDETSYFDIETTGLDYDAEITVIVCWHRGELHTFVEHENLDEFLDLLDDVRLLASFNGSSFDVPRVVDAFHIPGLPCPHIDLRWICYHRGFRGSLKDLSRRIGVERPDDLQDADGLLAVHLWNRWSVFADREARDQLLRYCGADVLLLGALAGFLVGRSVDGAGLWDSLPPCSAPPWSATHPEPTPSSDADARGAAARPPIRAGFRGASPQQLRGKRWRVAS